MTTKGETNKVTATLKVVVTGEFYDDNATEETLRYCVEQDLEDSGFDVDVSLLKEQKSEWLEDTDFWGTTWSCRMCMHSLHEPFAWDPYIRDYKYCPHCGAEMKAKSEDKT